MNNPRKGKVGQLDLGTRDSGILFRILRGRKMDDKASIVNRKSADSGICSLIEGDGGSPSAAPDPDGMRSPTKQDPESGDSEPGTPSPLSPTSPIVPDHPNDKATKKGPFRLWYLGKCVLDRRYTSPMLPWVVAELRRTSGPSRQEISLQLTKSTVRGSLQGEDNGLLFEHKLQQVARMARNLHYPNCFAYLTRESSDSPFAFHAFEAHDSEKVPEIFASIRLATKEYLKDNPHVDSRLDQYMDNKTSKFEVIYCGKVVVSHTKAPPTLIDDTIDKFKIHDAEKLKQQKKPADNGKRRLGSTSRESEKAMTNLANNNSKVVCTEEECRTSQEDTRPNINSCETQDAGNSEKKRHRSNSGGNVQNRTMLFQIGTLEVSLISLERKSVILEKNFKDISFVSQGIKQAEHFGFICRESSKSSRHMCYVFRCQAESVVDEVMQCLKQAFNAAAESQRTHIVCETCPMHQYHKLALQIEGLYPPRAKEVIQAHLQELGEADQTEISARIKSANPTGEQDENEITMAILRSLYEGRQKVHTHISDISQDGHRYPSKFDVIRNRAKKSLANSFESLLSRRTSAGAIFTAKGKGKQRHASEPMGNGQSARDRAATLDSGAAAAAAAKPSLEEVPETAPLPTSLPLHRKFPLFRSTSLHPARAAAVDSTTRREKFFFTRSISMQQNPSTIPPPLRLVDDSPGPPTSAPPTPGKDQVEHKFDLEDSPFQLRKRSNTLDHVPPRRNIMKEIRSSPLASRSSSKDSLSDSSTGSKQRLHASISSPPDTPQGYTPHRRMSWRQAIFTRVVTPGRNNTMPGTLYVHELDETLTTPEASPKVRSVEKPRKRTREELRALWKKAIMEQILLIRMERENINLKARMDAVETKRTKLDYDVILPCSKNTLVMWDGMLGTPNRAEVKFNPDELLAVVRAGVPKVRRGEIWRLLAEQYQLRNKHSNAPPEIPYEELIRQLTSHQHAILIDLGRTFPSHAYFSTQLGAGQLALFNLLKAYSLLDREVGYCQGLSFVAGILLMHMTEEEAFHMLTFSMYQLGFRRQYRPDMVALQIQMYQLSRLLHDNHRELYEHLEKNDIAPTLYAAPWFLTLFASQFPLGFVTRVFDLIFLQGTDVIFKVALTLLGDHEDLIMACQGFENIVDFIKNQLPALGMVSMEKAISRAFELDISKQLHAYEVEYHVLQEEMISSPQRGDVDRMEKLEQANRNLKRQNMELLEKLQTSHSSIHSLEATVASLQSEQNKLRSSVQTLEIERAALLNTVTKLRRLLPNNCLIEEELNFSIVNEMRANVGLPPLSKNNSSSSSEDLDTEVANITNKTRTIIPNQLRHRNMSGDSIGSSVSAGSTASSDLLCTENLQNTTTSTCRPLST
ncbi:TBC1 domain family member 1-like isoform X4 [Branchiostoma floridae]|uniref:TBC1 domain family member 4 n=1 Tax=Branchiostoma floridae TaxID=7739 RepID=A0A9J7LDX2_BRAFL|nr:TBC1 domain family member 1-like isoform X4 [Branchiostoma floridae]